MKRFLATLVACTLLLTGCGNTTTDTTTDNSSDTITEEVTDIPSEPFDVKVIMPAGTPALSAVQMVTENPTITENSTVSYEIVDSTDVLTTTLINKEADIAIVPTNLAANLYNKDLGYKIAGSSVGGVLYIASVEDISSLEDLKGKSIGVIGRNMTPDAILRYVLTENGIDPDEDLTLEYFAGAPELATNFIAGETDTSMAPQPVLTNMLMKREGSSVVVDLQEEWSKITGYDTYPQASIIVSTDLIENQPEFVDAFLNVYDNSVDWVNENPLEAGTYYENLDIGLSATLLEKAIPNCALDYVSVSEGKDSISSYLDILYNFNPDLVGGSVPDEDFYFEN